MVKTLGIMGLTAAGKSYFTDVFIKLCDKEHIVYYHFDADKEASRFVEAHKSEIKKILGLNQNASDNELKKARNSAIFENTKEKEEYQNYIWNGLRRELLVKRDEFRTTLSSLERGVFIINAPLLLSSKWYSLCDTIAEVKTDSDVRKKRFISRDLGLGYTLPQAKEHFERVERAYGKEKAVDRTQFWTIIYKINNTVNMVDNHLELEARVILNTVFEDE